MVVKARSLTLELPSKLTYLRLVEENGIPSVEVKFVDIGKNTSGEGDFLGQF